MKSNLNHAMENREEEKLVRARKRVAELKGFYVHLVIYIIINTFFTVNKLIRDHYSGATFSESFWEFSTFAVWVFWGLGLGFHAIKTFGKYPFLGKKWEERQIARYMEDERKRAEKFR